MAEEKKSIFRKESLDRISSPEEYDHYLQVTGAGVWMALGVTVVLLIGAFIWAVFGRLTTTVNVAVAANGESVVCMIPVEKMDSMKSLDADEMVVSIADQKYVLKDTGRAPEMISAGTDPSILIAGELMEGSFVTVMDVDAELPEGIYVGKIQVEQVSPISFILN